MTKTISNRQSAAVWIASPLLITIGGLGPTEDDVTKKWSPEYCNASWFWTIRY
jgi:molybdopterin-biosynthesis enzyme MoeA-like protein